MGGGGRGAGWGRERIRERSERGCRETRQGEGTAACIGQRPHLANDELRFVDHMEELRVRVNVCAEWWALAPSGTHTRWSLWKGLASCACAGVRTRRRGSRRGNERGTACLNVFPDGLGRVEDAVAEGRPHIEQKEGIHRVAAQTATRMRTRRSAAVSKQGRAGGARGARAHGHPSIQLSIRASIHPALDSGIHPPSSRFEPRRRHTWW